MIFVGGSVVDSAEAPSSSSEVPSLLFSVFLFFMIRIQKHGSVYENPTLLSCSIPFQRVPLISMD